MASWSWGDSSVGKNSVVKAHGPLKTKARAGSGGSHLNPVSLVSSQQGLHGVTLTQKNKQHKKKSHLDVAATRPVTPVLVGRVRKGGSLGLPGYQPGSRFSEKLCLKGVKEWRREKGRQWKEIQGDE